MNTVDWYGCYDGSWQSAPLVPEAYAHPAKVSFNLAERIYRHMLTEGWLQPGDAVLDPFGGIGGFAFHAALYGMHWTGIELEQRFVDLGNRNIALWQTRYAPHFPGYGTARLLQGDSRRLVEVVTGAWGIVSSPPYADALNTRDHGIVDARRQRNHDDAQPSHYGTTPGQLGAMPVGIVSSPPYASALNAQTDGIDWTKGKDDRDFSVEPGQEIRLHMGKRYGSTPGNLGNMPAGVVSSPPFGTGDSASAQSLEGRTDKSAQWIRDNTRWSTGYGDSAGQLAQESGNTFWSAAAAIVAQCYAILRPGGYAAWVTGDFVRNKRRVPFGEQWLNLCVSCGFEPVLWAVAWKSEHNGTQHGLFGEAQELRTEKVSFFRRLANAKRPETAIVNEDVLFVRKPA